MVIKIFVYISVLSAIMFFPMNYLESLLVYFEKILNKYKNQKYLMPMYGQLYIGDLLLTTINDLEAKSILGLKLDSNFNHQYKFYTNLIWELFSIQRKMGVSIKKFLPEIKNSILNDLQFERKVKDENISAFLQFLVIALTTWGFVYFSQLLADVKVDRFHYLIMIVLQILGVLIYLKINFIVKKNSFYKFNKTFEELYLFMSMSEVGVSINESLQYSQLLQGQMSCHKNFSKLFERVEQIIDRYRTIGIKPGPEIQLVIKEVWQLQEQEFAKYTKKVQLVRFTVLVFFYLPAYFIYLKGIFQFFMEQ